MFDFRSGDESESEEVQEFGFFWYVLYSSFALAAVIEFRKLIYLLSCEVALPEWPVLMSSVFTMTWPAEKSHPISPIPAARHPVVLLCCNLGCVASIRKLYSMRMTAVIPVFDLIDCMHSYCGSLANQWASYDSSICPIYIYIYP